MTYKAALLWIFAALSTLCFLAECYEIILGISVSWSDHLHNLLDHMMFFVINYIGLKLVRSQ
jgi:hypothetical protein